MIPQTCVPTLKVFFWYSDDALSIAEPSKIGPKGFRQFPSFRNQDISVEITSEVFDLLLLFYLLLGSLPARDDLSSRGLSGKSFFELIGSFAKRGRFLTRYRIDLEKAQNFASPSRF